jgi:acetyl esterase/lipase
LIFAVCEDNSLPVDKDRIAIGGYSAGGALSLGVCQLPSIRDRIKPSAVCPIYPYTDFSLNIDERLPTRYYKTGLGKDMRGKTTDSQTPILPFFLWSYPTTGQDLCNPLISPIYCDRDELPPHIFFIAAELDLLAHEAWEMASKCAGRQVPDKAVRTGQEAPARETGALILDDEKFYFHFADESGKSVRWLLVPDVIHSFDHISSFMQGSQQAADDAGAKTVAYQRLLGEWLLNEVWR